MLLHIVETMPKCSVRKKEQIQHYCCESGSLSITLFRKVCVCVCVCVCVLQLIL